MSKAEEQALKAYPYENGVKGEICKASIPIYIQGYEQALKDLLDVAIECEVFDDWLYGKDADHKTQPAIKYRSQDWKIGQKVKVIIIKE